MSENRSDTSKLLQEMNDRAFEELKEKLYSAYPSYEGVLDEGVHFLQKPFTILQLSEKIKSILTATAAHTKKSAQASEAGRRVLRRMEP